MCCSCINGNRVKFLFSYKYKRWERMALAWGVQRLHCASEHLPSAFVISIIIIIVIIIVMVITVVIVIIILIIINLDLNLKLSWNGPLLSQKECVAHTVQCGKEVKCQSLWELESDHCTVEKGGIGKRKRGGSY